MSKRKLLLKVLSGSRNIQFSDMVVLVAALLAPLVEQFESHPMPPTPLEMPA
jgi:hypothetical protein